MTSKEIRQSFLDFFEGKGHEIVPSASLMPTAPNLLFTNAGMNPFVPVFLGERTPPATRVADTQKCIRAGGKHNDLEDVGFDAYHHTFFEMLGNWSFGDYFKEEALTWSWELLTKVWGIPKERLYVTVYQPGPGDPADFDQEAYDVWKGILEADGLDPDKHIQNSGKKDNFWMMGDTGPCGPCSEMHIDLRPENFDGSLVNADSPWCIELWNDVFIQFNATGDGQFLPLKQKHVDTGLGFERICGIFATTKNFTDFSRPPSNYDSDLFTDLFDHLTTQCGHTYGATLPESRSNLTEQELKDMAFRVVADHARTLSLAVADGILPGNEGRGYVLRRILRRAVVFGQQHLGLENGFFAGMIQPVTYKLGEVFPELVQQQEMVRKVINAEEQSFARTLDRGLMMLQKILEEKPDRICGTDAFTLYDTYGFPLDLTQLLAQQEGLTVDVPEFERCMEEQKQRARAAQKKGIVEVKGSEEGEATEFVGFEIENLTEFTAEVKDIIESDDAKYIVTDKTPFYAEMGGQIGDTGSIQIDDTSEKVIDTTKASDGRYLHKVESTSEFSIPSSALLSVDLERREVIQRHHTATHILHWALRKVLGEHVQQAGSYVGPDRLRFDYSHFEQPSKAQLQEIERLCNEKLLANHPVVWREFPFDQKPGNAKAFFGDKYGDIVRVVGIGENISAEDPASFETGWSVELCGGTHTQATGEIGLIKIVAESSISAGTRRIEALAGERAYELAEANYDLLQKLAGQFSCKPDELEKRLEASQKHMRDLESELKQLKRAQSADLAGDLINRAREKNGMKILAAKVDADNPNALRTLSVDTIKKLGEGVVVLGGAFGEKVTLVTQSSPEAIKAGYKAGDIVRELTGKLGGKGGGKPDFAMGGGTDAAALESILNEWQQNA